MVMPERDSLHQLVDTLPEAALEAVERALQHFQTWPPEMPRDAQNMQKRMKELIAERTAQRGGRSRMGSGSLIGDGDCVMSGSGSKDGAEVTIELRRFRGHELQIERRLGVSRDKRKLLYALLIKGPDGKEAHREIEFDLADD
ncbi:MAG: hypothetical protein ABSA59_11765 [Terriglobia bacterium]|jgi:hypothetical protein